MIGKQFLNGRPLETANDEHLMFNTFGVLLRKYSMGNYNHVNLFDKLKCKLGFHRPQYTLYKFTDLADICLYEVCENCGLIIVIRCVPSYLRGGDSDDDIDFE